MRGRGGEKKTVGWEQPPPSPSPSPSPSSSFFFFYPRASNAICTANGLMIRRCQAKGRTKSAAGCLELRARSQGAILGDAAATPKMAGLAHEVRHVVVFCWVLVAMAAGRR